MSLRTDNFDGPNTPAAGAETRPQLPIAEVGAANRNAQFKGIGLGVGSGVLAGLVARRSLRLSPNASALSGFITGSFIAWYGSRQFLIKGLQGIEAQLKPLHAANQGSSSQGGAAAIGPGQHRGILHPSASAEAEAYRLDLKSAGERRFEAGTGGLHELRDPYATTRGDH